MTSGKKMHTSERKLEIVKKYLNDGMSLKAVAEEYHVSHSEVQKWRDAYLEHGIAGLNTTHRTYTGDFKCSVVE